MRIVFGGEVINKSAASHPTIEHLRADNNLATVMGFTWSAVEVRVNGTVQTTGTLVDSDRIDIVTKANGKGC